MTAWPRPAAATSEHGATARTRRLVHLTAGRMYGGIETFLATVARHRALAPGVETAFALCYEGRLADELRATGAEVHVLGTVRMRELATVAAARRRLSKALRPDDVLVSHGTWVQGLFGDLAREAAGNVFFMHGPARGWHWTELLARARRPDGVICNSAYTASTLPRLYPRVPRAVCTIPVELDVDCSSRAAVRSEMAVPPERVVVFLGARLEAWKGHELLLRALAEVRTARPWEAWIAGGPQHPSEERYLARLAQLASAGGIAERVRFLGQRTDVPRLLCASDIHCQPNAGPEPFGIAFVEALASRLPVVTTAFGGGAEIVTPECGVLLPPGDVAGLTAALARLIDDPAERRRLGANGPARANELCAPERQVPRIAALAQSLAAARSQPPGAAAPPA